jgi:D-glycero-D-manno-heptose 1,7-bisphosphate phosphatase
MNSPLHRAVFLDRDGVLNRPVVREGKPFPPGTLEEFEIYPEAIEACRRLKEAGLLLVVATNQPDVGRGTQRMEVVEAMHERLRAALPVDRIEVCYEAGGPGAAPSEMRKPRPGMLRRAARELGIDLGQSFLVGDRWRDIDCGHAAGCVTLFIDRGYAEALEQPPHFRVGNVAEAANIILECIRGARAVPTAR